MLQRSILCMQGTQYATKRSILCRGAFCGPTLLRLLNLARLREFEQFVKLNVTTGTSYHITIA